MADVNWDEIGAGDVKLTEKTGFDPWPKGSKIRCKVEKASHDSRPGKGRCFAVGFSAVEGDFAGQWAWMNAWTERNANPETDQITTQIGLRKIRALYEAIGLPLFDNTDNIKADDCLESLVTVVTGKPNRWRNAQGDEKISTEIVGFESATPQAPVAQAIAPATTPAAADDDAPF